VLLAPILRNDPNTHLPSLKKTGWHGSTPREYLKMNGVTVERTSKSVIFHLKRRFIRLVSNPEDIDKAEQEVKDFLIDAAMKFQELYPTIVLDLMNAKIIRKEIEIKDPKLKIPKNLLMRDTLGKKVYKKTDSIELYSPDLLKRFIKNRAIEDWSPELAAKLDVLIDSNLRFAKNLDLHLQVLQDIRNSLKRESFLTKIGNFIKKIIKMI
jgi:hypothetical protein